MWESLWGKKEMEKCYYILKKIKISYHKFIPQKQTKWVRRTWSTTFYKRWHLPTPRFKQPAVIRDGICTHPQIQTALVTAACWEDSNCAGQAPFPVFLSMHGPDTVLAAISRAPIRAGQVYKLKASAEQRKCISDTEQQPTCWDKDLQTVST